MNASKDKSKPTAKTRLAKSSFASKAVRAMIKAQQGVAEENARYGLPLIVEKTAH